MLVFFKENLVFLAVPKTGTTAYEMALRHRADIIYRKRPTLKHTPARKYYRMIAPYLDKAHDLRPETMAVIRNPLDQLGSWYRYRQKPDLDGLPNSTKGMRFADFVERFLSIDPPPAARVGSQFKFVSTPTGEVLVNHLFAYEKPTALISFLEDRFQSKLKVPVKNVSPKNIDLTLPPDLLAHLRRTLAEDFDLHEKVLKAGHYQLV